MLAVQFGLSGLLGLLAAQFFPPALLIGFVLMTLTPSGITAPVAVDLYGGNVARTTQLTSLSNVMAPLVMPALALLFVAHSVPVAPLDLFTTIFLLVLIPMGLAYVLRNAKVTDKIKPHRRFANLLLLTFLIWGLTANSAAFFYAHPLQSLAMALALLAISIILLLVGAHIGKTKADRIAHASLCYHKNTTLAVTLLAAFYGPVPAAVGVMYNVITRITQVASIEYFKRQK